LNAQSDENEEINYKNYKKIEYRYICPTKEVDPNHYMEPDLVTLLYLFPKLFKINKERFVEVFNCVHCNACKMDMARFYTKKKLIDNGFISNSTKIMRESFRKWGTPFNTNKYRVKIPETLQKDSDTLLFMGCLSYLKVPKFTQHAIEYLINKGIDFTILEHEFCCGIPAFESGDTESLSILMKDNKEILNRFKKIICLCPACFDIFSNFYTELEPEIVYISDYFVPLKKKRNEKISIQHLCQLEYRNRPTMEFVNNVLKQSGFIIMEDEKHWCCGGGMGMAHIENNIERIARIRVNDFHGEILTTYCPSCYHILKLFSRKEKITPKLIDTFQLLTE